MKKVLGKVLHTIIRRMLLGKTVSSSVCWSWERLERLERLERVAGCNWSEQGEGLQEVISRSSISRLTRGGFCLFPTRRVLPVSPRGAGAATSAPSDLSWGSARG